MPSKLQVRTRWKPLTSQQVGFYSFEAKGGKRADKLVATYWNDSFLKCPSKILFQHEWTQTATYTMVGLGLPEDDLIFPTVLQL